MAVTAGPISPLLAPTVPRPSRDQAWPDTSCAQTAQQTPSSGFGWQCGLSIPPQPTADVAQLSKGSRPDAATGHLHLAVFTLTSCQGNSLSLVFTQICPNAHTQCQHYGSPSMSLRLSLQPSILMPFQRWSIPTLCPCLLHSLPPLSAAA